MRMRTILTTWNRSWLGEGVCECLVEGDVAGFRVYGE